MRLLYLHVSEAWYRAVRPALREPPDPPGESSVSEALLAFFTVEEGDDESVVANAARDIASHARSLKVDTILLYPYAHLSPRLAPPKEAYRLSRMLEEEVRKLFQGKVLRAPFGWYKEFGVSCKGHPLAELSRTFTAWSGGETWQSWLKSWPREVLEAYSRIGFENPVTGRQALGELRELVESRLGRPEERAWAQIGPGEALKLCLSGKDQVLGPREGLEVLGGEGGLDAVGEVVKGLFREAALEPPNIVEGEGGFLHAAGRLVGAASGSRACIGPLSGLVMLLVEEGLKAAERGVTPYLPFWLTPTQVALVPARGGEEAARSLYRWLKSVGARAVLLGDGGLGQRVRAAGRSWASIVAVIGSREAETGTVTVRRRWEPGKQETLTVNEFKGEVLELLSKQPSRS